MYHVDSVSASVLSFSQLASAQNALHLAGAVETYYISPLNLTQSKDSFDYVKTSQRFDLINDDSNPLTNRPGPNCPRSVGASSTWTWTGPAAGAAAAAVAGAVEGCAARREAGRGPWDKSWGSEGRREGGTQS